MSLLHELALTYSSCVEHPIQRLIFAIAANLNLKVYRGDAKDAFAHSSCATYIDRLVTTQGWKEDKHMQTLLKTIAPISTKVLKQVYNQKGPIEGTTEHKALKSKAGSYD